MITNLNKWYRVSSISDVTEDTLTKRSTSISNILENKDLLWLLECVRLYLNKPQKSKTFLNEFFLEFNNEDRMFLEEDGDVENRILAGAVIDQSIKTRTHDNIEISLAIKSAIFGIEHNTILNADIVENAINFLATSAIEKRDYKFTNSQAPKYPIFKDETITVEYLATHIKLMGTYIKAADRNFELQNQSLKTRIKVLEEESNIHWWLFRSYSSIMNKSVKDLKGIETPLVLALELNNLITVLPPPPNYKDFLKLVINNVAKPKNSEISFSIKESVQSLLTTFQEEIVDEPESSYGNLTPILLGYSNALATSGDEAWIAMFEKNTGLKADANFASADIADQLLTELVLIKIGI